MLDRGLKYDRRWMLVDADGRFISQRSHPQLALIETSISSDYLHVSYLGDQHKIPLAATNGEQRDVIVWDDTLNAYVADTNDSRWFSEVLNMEVTLVSMQQDSRRPVDPRYAVSHEEEVSFADGYPFLIIGRASMDLLNEKLVGEPLLIDRFRPNLVFDGGKAHEEDTWQSFSVGSVDFYGVKPCARCQVTTIDQQTGVSGKEPLKSLARYRRKGNKILFGQNCLMKKSGVIKVGDRIEVTRRGEPAIV